MKEIRCCICGRKFTGYGNNPAPVRKRGRCCDDCNYLIVIPKRIELLAREMREATK